MQVWRNRLKRWLPMEIFGARRLAVFVKSLPKNARVLDVGCGNNSPTKIKLMRPDVYYVGIDVANYRQPDVAIAYGDEYKIVTPGDFAAEIANRKGAFDAVISSHNIEHCDQPSEVLEAMVNALGPGGRLYFSFPSAASVNFPHRTGTLNFYDDPTHKTLPDGPALVSALEAKGATVEYCAFRYRPPLYWLLGLLLEPVSAISKRVLRGTWAFYGFETIIWAARR